MRARRSACALLLLAFAALAAPLVAQPSRSPVFSGAELMASVATLASADMEGRRTGTAGNARARDWIVQQFRGAGLSPVTPDFQMPFAFTPRDQRSRPGATADVQGVNVLGICRGTGAADGGAMIITAHYDHVGVRDGAVYHGADDNASGVAVLLALARQCDETPWIHDAVFAAFDAEELGLQGARAFVAAPPLAKEPLAININLDMVARGDRGELYAAGTHHTPALRTVLEPVASRAKVRLLFGHDSGGGRDDWTMQSDHGAFHMAGIPFVYFGVEDHPDYHKPTDTVDKIDSGFFFRAAVTILDAVTAVDRALPLPSRRAAAPRRSVPR